MKFHGLLIGLFFMHTLCQAQNDIPDSLLRHYYKYPKTALQAAGEMYRSAQSEHNTPLLIKSLILKTTFSLQVNRNDYPKMLKELETYTAQEKNIPAQCILHSYLGELYLQYYANNNYRINQRTPLQGEVPEDLNEWSGNLFLDKILSHFSASVQPGEILQRTPVKDYQTILIPGNASDSLRPTLYDFLCHRAIKQLDLTKTSVEVLVSIYSVNVQPKSLYLSAATLPNSAFTKSSAPFTELHIAFLVPVTVAPVIRAGV